MAVKILVFDMDGTLLDNEAYERQFWDKDLVEEAANETGKSEKVLSREAKRFIAACKNTPKYFYPQAYLSALGARDYDVHALIRKHLQLVKPWPWVKPALLAARKNFLNVVFTNAVEEVALAKLRATGLERCFHLVNSTHAYTKFEEERFQELFVLLDRLFEVDGRREALFFSDDVSYGPVARRMGLRIERVRPGGQPAVLKQLLSERA